MKATFRNIRAKTFHFSLNKVSFYEEHWWKPEPDFEIMDNPELNFNKKVSSLP
jgi:hypothetical protein